MNDKYLLSAGEFDRQRLSILNKLYNPPALAFLKKSGLESGMTVLEVGCGTGHMACLLANFIGSKGKVIAIDNNQQQIEIAMETAKQLNVSNIEFHLCNVFDIAKLAVNYDATYGRWVIEFSQRPEQALALMYENLNPGGILAYEASNMKQTAYFSYPDYPIIEQWHNITPKLFSAYNYKLNFGHEIYSIFRQLNCHSIKLTTSQAILSTPEEKSVYRLGLMTSKETILEKSIMAEQEIEILKDALQAFEHSDAISGFYQNILISGIK